MEQTFTPLQFDKVFYLLDRIKLKLKIGTFYIYNHGDKNGAVEGFPRRELEVLKEMDCLVDLLCTVDKM